MKIIQGTEHVELGCCKSCRHWFIGRIIKDLQDMHAPMDPLIAVSQAGHYELRSRGTEKMVSMLLASTQDLDAIVEAVHLYIRPKAVADRDQAATMMNSMLAQTRFFAEGEGATHLTFGQDTVNLILTVIHIFGQVCLFTLFPLMIEVLESTILHRAGVKRDEIPLVDGRLRILPN